MSVPRRAFAAVAVAATLTAGGVALAVPSQRAVPGASLPTSIDGQRPGPDILYASPADAPQLQNTGVWRAQPLLVSGASAYEKGEWLYQDFLYDDHGATGARDPNDPYGANADLYSPPAGTFTYPTAKLYANNAADLVEFRVKPLSTATAFRVTLNTLLDASKSAFTIALGDSSSAVSWPYGAGVSSPAALFLTWHGSTATLIDASGKTLTPPPTVAVDTLRRQITIVVTHAAWNPGAGKVRMTIGTGLWDATAGGYLKPQPGSATDTTPGGGTPNGVAIVNVGPRLNEPMPIFAGATLPDTAVSGQALAYFWRERQQSEQLAMGDVSPFSADVDFAKLAAGVIDESGVPKTGPIDRILASHYSFGQGYNPANVCFDLASSFSAGAKCVGRMVGQLQPYAIFVPKKPAPSHGYGLTLLLHSLSANYNQYLDSRNQSELGERGPGSIVITPSGRGPDGFDGGIAESDTFEVWNDVARNYRLDPDWTVVTGYSMGGFSTYRLLARWPDLFARGWSVVGAPGSVDDQLVSLRNTPLLLWNATFDELVNLQTSENALKDDEAAGLRVSENLFTGDHLTLAANDQFQPGVDWLGTARVERDPARVSYVVDRTEDSSLGQVVANHAYWLSGLQPRGSGDATVDVLSQGFGQGIPAVLLQQAGAGALTGGNLPVLPYVSRTQAWGPTPPTGKGDVLVIKAHNLAAMTIDPQRAHVDCNARLQVTSDGPLAVHLLGCVEPLGAAAPHATAVKGTRLGQLPRTGASSVASLVALLLVGCALLVERQANRIRQAVPNSRQ